ncbi:MAG: SMC-Scp complex subunit ScpB [Burkholderiaceae bacterium]|jgi:segregation and condensation protein B|nr:SMC-Scp complex subunit ScpB [Burkholderiaceae bacterium]
MTEEKKILETALLCAQESLSMQDMKNLLENTGDENDVVWMPRIRRLLSELQGDWSDRGLELVQVADGWRFQSKPEMKPWLDRLTRERQPRYSRSTLEILAIIAYNQPVTRGDIEQMRGVAINPNAIRSLEERGWIEVVGHRETPGRPALFATTARFLGDLGLASLEQLPPLVQSMGDDAPDESGIET